MALPPLASTEADLEALDKLCDTLSGFGHDLSTEWVDGFLTALLAGPRLVPPSEWLPALCGDAFERAFADPADLEHATATLMARWNVIASQLDPEALVDAQDTVRLAPLMLDFDDAARAAVVAAGEMTDEQAREALQTGAVWADGFQSAIDAFSADWPDPAESDPEAEWYDHCRSSVVALMLGPDELATFLAEAYPDETLDRDQLIDEACFAVQDLRLYWLEHAPRPPTRRVDPKPGRNDPCPCGSGLKYKKCHGAQ